MSFWGFATDSNLHWWYIKAAFGLENYSYRHCSLVPVWYYLTDTFVFAAVIVCTHKMTISVDASARKGELSHPAIAVCLSVQTNPASPALQ